MPSRPPPTGVVEAAHRAHGNRVHGKKEAVVPVVPVFFSTSGTGTEEPCLPLVPPPTTSVPHALQPMHSLTPHAGSQGAREAQLTLHYETVVRYSAAFLGQIMGDATGVPSEEKGVHKDKPPGADATAPVLPPAAPSVVKPRGRSLTHSVLAVTVSLAAGEGQW